MTTVGAFEAKTHFARLLDRVARGEQVVISKHGKPMARLVPVAGPDRGKAREAIARLKDFRKGRTLDGIRWTELRGEGRR